MRFRIPRITGLRVFLPILCLLPVYPPEAGGAEDEVFQLSPFTVTTSEDVGYLSTNSTSGTSLNTAIKDLPMSIQVINQDFITDIGASDLEEALSYAAGVFTSDNAASNSVGATRGSQGGGAGDRSISSAGSGSRFANLVYIRGLSTPYQNRMGFRYGGLVVTPNSDVALGGMLDASNIERIEVVKGPNSLLYGVGVLTGIVNVIPEKPLSEPRYELTLRGGSYDFFRTQAEATGPLRNKVLPGQLNYRLAGSWEDRGSWTAFRKESNRYGVAQLDYTPYRWVNIFLEYQEGKTRIDGIGSQWIYDAVNSSKDTEFRNAYDEAYNWARHDGRIVGLKSLDPDGFDNSLAVVDATGATGTLPGFLQTGTDFSGGGKGNDYRISGPDTFAERNEKNYLLDVTLTPSDSLTINAGSFFSEQDTFERNLQFGSGNTSDAINFVLNTIPTDGQLNGIWRSGGVYGVPMQPTVREVFGLTSRVNPDLHEGTYVLPATTDDLKLIEYIWRDSIVKSKSEQYRLRGTYEFETPFVMGPAKHTLLAGFSYIEDDVDFPDGGINRGNARANPSRTRDFSGGSITEGSEGVAVADPFDNDGLYYRSIANFEPIYFDGRNDGVDGHNTVRAGDAYLNQVIKQSGYYGVYQGKFWNERLEVIFGLRKDIYNAKQLTYKRADVSDAFLRSEALKVVEKEAFDVARSLTSDPSEQARIRDEIIASQTGTDRYIATWYRDSFESGDEGYFGYANRGGAPDANFGVVPGSVFDIFEEDVEVTTFTAGMNFDINDSLTLYGLTAEGVSPNTALRDGAGEIIPAEETLNKEIGLKFDLLEGKVSGNIAFFRIDRKNAIWDVIYAPNASKWADARQSANRSSDYTFPTYTPEAPTTYYVLSDYMVEYFSKEFDINPELLNFAQVGDQLQQDIQLTDLDPSLSVIERLRLIQNIRDNTLLPEEFANKWDSQAPLGGNVQVNFVGINPEGFDDAFEVTLYNPETNKFVTRTISNLPVIYGAFMDRNIDFTKNDLVSGTHPIRYDRLTSFGLPQFNNNVDMARRALVTFDEEINGFDFEIFLTPTDNLQFVVNFTHVEREAKDAFDFTEWDSITGVQGSFISPFTMLHREFGWENAGIDLAWVNYADYAQALAASADGVVGIAELQGAEIFPEGTSDEPISPETFASRAQDGKILLFVDKRGNVINENNNAMATDYEHTLKGVSLNFNPEDELSVFGKYSFSEGLLEKLSLTAGVKYIGASRTSVAFNTVSPLVGLTVTPDVPERYQLDLGASYRWKWNNVDMRLSLNIYNLFDDTYAVSIKTLDTSNPITGQTVTKRTEKFYSPTTVRVGLTMAF